jgi:hypothetical protein
VSSQARAPGTQRVELVVLTPLAVDEAHVEGALNIRTSWPHSSSSRLTQGEWVFASMATHIGTYEPRVSGGAAFLDHLAVFGIEQTQR